MEVKNDNQPILIKDALADKKHPHHKAVSEIVKKLESGEINMCACMGRIGEDPYCPCEMTAKGLTPTNTWTPEKIAELEQALTKVFNWK